jgi:tRNA-splicing endonuclease subunit Sen34
MSEDAVRKRKEREERKRAQAAAKAAAEATEEGSSSVFVPSESETKPLPPTEPVSSPTDLSKNSSAPYTIVIPASSSSLEWYDDSECSYSTIESAREAGVWDYPSNLSERARCGVFKDLWKQGYFMGGGIKFGGEYLVYPGTFAFLFHLQATRSKQIPR